MTIEAANPSGALNIGNLTLPNPVILAPMSGVTDAPFRRLVARLGAGLVVSEMTASDALVEGRPNGMPAWGGKIPDEQLWQIATYVRSLSLPATLAADHSDTPGQQPAPVPKDADDHAGWSPPPDTTNDFTAVLTGPGQ